MAQNSQSPLCSACKQATFEMLLAGFEHPLTYAQTLQSGKTCKLCRLMVCMYSKLQTHKSRYDVDKDYDLVSLQLAELPAVRRHFACGVLVERMELPPKHFQWEPDDILCKYDGQVQKGTFSDGATIQISAPEDSGYLLSERVLLREVETATSSRNFGMLRHWLNDCISTHDQCGRSISGEVFDDSGDGEALPSRLIDVGSLECATLPRLVETRNLRGRYFTLSHRWGDSLEYRTTKETLKEYKGVLPLDLMPQSFRDAMEVTRQLGFQYLWIDSICIIQDDEDDWRRESQQMGQIFERSCCTISAVDALDSDSNKDIGLFCSRCC